MNPNEEKLKQLQAEIEAKKAEIAEIKAVDQKAKAEEMASTEPTAEQMALLSGIGLQGNRGADGSMVTEAAKPSLEEVLNGLNIPAVLSPNMSDSKKKSLLTDAALGLDMDRSQLIMSPEFQAMFGDAYNDVADPLLVKVNLDQDEMTAEEIDAAADKKIQETMYDIDGNYRKDAKSAMMTDMGNPDQDRRMAMEDDIEDRSMGFKADEGGNMSVDEKDDFWKTQEGYNKAMEMYGTKPSFVPDEPTLVFNPVTQEYEEIKDEDKEEFVDFSQPRMSADLKALLG
tara:strand:- start:585 stop:1439 length:855 start_codon:yes stop_codon:yes gene_type:complete